MGHDPFNPNPFQKKALALWLRRHPVVSAMGGWSSGKTHLIAQVMQIQCETQPGVDGFYVTESYGTGEGAVGEILHRVLCPLGWRYRAGAIKYWVSPHINGAQTKVFVKSYKRASTKDRAANSLEGLNCGWGIADECNQLPGDEVAVAMQGRVRAGPTPQVMLLGKPHGSPWWLRFAERAPGGVAFRASSYANRDVMIANGQDFDAWVNSLPRRSYLENIMCEPQQPEGAVLHDWLAATHPEGNLAPEGWRPPDGAITYAAMDFGIRCPVGLAITHDPALDADVVWLDAAPDDATTADVCRMMLRSVWPAAYGRREGLVPLHRGCGDKAGGNRRTDGRSDFMDVARRPEECGLGLSLRRQTMPERVDVLNGIDALQRLIRDPHTGARRLLCCPRLWRAGLDVPGRSLAKSILGYQWSAGAKGAVPNKDGVHDHHIDTLRYHAINWHWPKADVPRDLYERPPEDASLEDWQRVAARER